ncbi:unnamed protein product [Schistocephalus solidus]|uniref:40S ribosomal protein S30 n=1 Tax=Schistocephalus solidus TaxID=70667 RepID=A0A183SUL9_SCHSO|nr:unnamed protein product [Schistocephalus solidus]
MQLIVRSLDTRVVDTNVCQSAADLKVLLSSEDRLPLEDIQLYHGNTILDNAQRLNELLGDAAVDVIVPTLGVRGQTPKVEKQDKKKKPRGRAKRRMQFNRRFAIVAIPGARRRGPNSNVKA